MMPNQRFNIEDKAKIQMKLETKQRERIIVPILQCFGKLKFTYLSKLRLPHYIVYSGAEVDEGAGVDEGARVDEGTKVDIPQSLSHLLWHPFLYSYSQSRQVG